MSFEHHNVFSFKFPQVISGYLSNRQIQFFFVPLHGKHARKLTAFREIARCAIATGCDSKMFPKQSCRDQQEPRKKSGYLGKEMMPLFQTEECWFCEDNHFYENYPAFLNVNAIESIHLVTNSQHVYQLCFEFFLTFFLF